MVTRIWRESDRDLTEIWQESDRNLMGIWLNSDGDLTEIWRESDENLTMMIDDSYFMDYIKQLGKGPGKTRQDNKQQKKQGLGGLR